jgi:hypothetical protein
MKPSSVIGGLAAFENPISAWDDRAPHANAYWKPLAT